MRKRRHRFVPALVAVALLAAGCSGERPQLLPPNSADTTVPAGTATTVPGAGVDVAALTPADCVTTTGPGPQQVIIEATPSPAVACTLLAAHHRVEFVNNTAEPATITLAGSSSTVVAPSESFVTEPVGTVLQPGINQVDAIPFPVTSLWFVDQGQNPLAGQTIGLSSVGDVALGQSAEAVTAAVGNRTLTSEATPCYVGAIDQDPYSPLFTFRDGSVAVIQVFTPGQLTRSAVGVGSSEGDVIAAYGQQVQEQPSPDGDANKKLLVFVPADEADQIHRLVFALESGQVASVRSGLTDFAVTNPVCDG